MESKKKITVPEIRGLKRMGHKIVMCTAYDFTIANLVDNAGVDVILVGDSLASTIQGEETTIPVTLEQMVYHTRCVAQGVTRALVVADMPFLSYQPSLQVAIESAGKLLKEGRASAVKLEGGLAIAETIERLVSFDIPVMGHVGLTPQSYHRMGGHKIQGKGKGLNEIGSRDRVLADARAVEAAGAFALVLEGIPSDLASEITSSISIPTIGIGAGPECDGQVLVINDLIGLSVSPVPSFVKTYANVADVIRAAVGQYAQEVRSERFPGNDTGRTAGGNGKTPLRPSNMMRI